MRAGLLIVTVVVVLAACGKSPREKAQATVDFLVERHASAEDICEAYKDLVAADLAEHDGKHWDMDKRMQRNACLNAELEKRLREPARF